MATSNVWETVVWEKVNDVGKWCPYSEEVCHLLEQAAKRNLNIVCLGDAEINLKNYYVKLNESVQISESTGTHYPIRRRRFREDSAVSTGIMWQWSGDRHNTWINYDVDVTNYIEEAYKDGKEFVDLSDKFPDYNYKLNLRKMHQQNKRNKARRAIRRALSFPFPVAKSLVDDAKADLAGASNCKDEPSPNCSTPSGTSTSGCSPVKEAPSNHLLKHVKKLWNKLKNPIDTDSDDKSDNSACLSSKKQCTDVNTVLMGTPSNHSSSIPNINSSNNSLFGHAACSASNIEEDSKYATVGGKPWRNHWVPHTNESDIKPVPGINPPAPFKKSRKDKKHPTVTIGNDVASVLSQYTEKIDVLPVKDEEDKECVICFEDLFSESSYSKDNTVVKLQLCRHIFHKSCLKAMYDCGVKDGCLQCPVCKTIHGEKCGSQPPGTMNFHVLPYSLPGNPDCSTIQILYYIPPGIQGPEHPNPGRRYTARGFPRRCYLPDNEDGRKVLRLLVKAWERRLIFTVGSSTTTGEENTVTWNEIHHKTEFGSNMFGHGFPDPNFIENILFELASQGVTES